MFLGGILVLVMPFRDHCSVFTFFSHDKDHFKIDLFFVVAL